MGRLLVADLLRYRAISFVIGAPFLESALEFLAFMWTDDCFVP